MCFGSQFDITPTWACWAYWPCSTRALFFVFGLWKVPAICCIYGVMLAAACVGFVVALACLPFTFTLLILLKMDIPGGFEGLKRLASPGLYVGCFLAGAVLFAFQIAWLGIALLYTCFLFVLSCVGFRTDTTGLFICLRPGVTRSQGDGDRMIEIFLFPMLFTLTVCGAF